MSKLILEEEEEAFVLENGWDTAIPISFTYTPEEGCVLHAFPQVADLARAFLSRYEKDPVSDRALAFLFEGMAPFFEKWGYKDDRFRDRWGYLLHAGDRIPEPKYPVRELTAEDEDCNDTTYDLTETCEAGCLVYGMVENGRVVSLAATHDAVDTDAPVLEVGVETVPAARGKGYATACLAALTAALRARGVLAEYRCQRYNTASRRTALSAGFCEVGKYYYYVGRRKNGL